MVDTRSPEAVAREDLLPLVENLCTLAREEGARDQTTFFEQVRSGIVNAHDAEDLAEPFLALSASGFMGFRFSPPVGLLLDEVLAVAHQLAMALGATEGEPH